MPPSKIFVLFIASIELLFSLNTLADQEFKVVAENGVELNVSKDDFANRVQVTGPSVKLKNPTEIESYGFVAKVDSPGNKVGLTIQGYLFTYGEGNNFSDLTPIFRGGEPLKMSITGRTKIACSWTCKYAYHFIIDMPMEKVRRYAEDGAVVMQFRSRDGTWKPTLTIPTDHFEAVSKHK